MGVLIHQLPLEFLCRVDAPVPLKPCLQSSSGGTTYLYKFLILKLYFIYSILDGWADSWKGRTLLYMPIDSAVSCIGHDW